MSHSDITRSRHLVVAAILVSAGSFASTTASADPLALVHPDQLVLEKCDEQFNRGPLIS